MRIEYRLFHVKQGGRSFSRGHRDRLVPPRAGAAPARPVEVRPVEVRPAEVRPAEVRPDGARPALGPCALAVLAVLLGAATFLGACRPDAVPPVSADVVVAPAHCCDERPRPPAEGTSRSALAPSGELGAAPMVTTPRSHPDLGFPRHGSVAVGTVTDGYLVDGATLPLVGPHHRVLPEQARRRTNFATDEMASLIQDAAARVAAEHPGAILFVGNIAKGGGGDIPWSVSHNTGLDADLSFYLRPEDPGAPAVAPETLVHIDREGRCVEIAQCAIDVPRTWSMVAALASHERAAVQWLFVSNPVRERLLAYARRIGAPRELVARVAAVLHQPRGALPHDDHVHVRLYCAPEDVLEGCRDRGPERPDRPAVEAALAERLAAVRRFTRDENPKRRAGAVELLRLLADRGSANDVIARLDDEVPAVRDVALRAARDLRLRRAIRPIADLLAHEGDPERRWNLIAALGAIGGPEAGDVLVSRLEDMRPAARGGPFAASPSSVRRRAAILLAEMDAKGAVGPLVAALGRKPEPGFARQAESALRLLTNHAFPDREGAPLANAWRRWWQRNKRFGRERWLVEGFQNAGYRLQCLDRNGIPVLLDAIWDERPWITRNARRALSQLARQDTGSERWSRVDAFQYWKRWCVRTQGARRCRTRR